MKCVNAAFEELKDFTGTLEDGQQEARYPEALNTALQAILSLDGFKFSPERDAPSLAGDINRRFLPQFQEEWRIVQREERDSKIQIETFQQKVAMLKKVPPNMRPSWGSSGPTHGDFHTDLAGLTFKH